jgi:miniconductance mechanosensitive channel
MEHINPGHWTRALLEGSGLNDWWISSLTILIDLAVLIAASLLADFITRRIVIGLIHRAVKRTKATWDDHFFKEKVFQALVHIMPTLIIRGFLPVVFEDVPGIIAPLQTILGIFLVYQVVILINRAARAGSYFVEELEAFQDKPVRTVLSVVQFLTWFIGVLAVVSALTSTPLASILGALAGATAIFILIFQDAINGLLANFQIVLYDLIKKGDWITFDKFGVDGDVVSIDLTTVKIKNFDNTISSVPAKAFVTDSFINWRGMRLAQVRRIKRNLVIDLESVAFVNDEVLAEFKKIERVRPYLTAREREIAAHNSEFGVDKSHPVNGRHMTNLGVFRAYAHAYLEEHPSISNAHTLMVRQLPVTGQGIPLEVYCFANTIVFTEYEGIASDLFDHLIAAAPSFGLNLFQAPTAASVRGGAMPFE